MTNWEVDSKGIYTCDTFRELYHNNQRLFEEVYNSAQRDGNTELMKSLEKIAKQEFKRL